MDALLGIAIVIPLALLAYRVPWLRTPLRASVVAGAIFLVACVALIDAMDPATAKAVRGSVPFMCSVGGCLAYYVLKRRHTH